MGNANGGGGSEDFEQAELPQPRRKGVQFDDHIISSDSFLEKKEETPSHHSHHLSSPSNLLHLHMPHLHDKHEEIKDSLGQTPSINRQRPSLSADVSFAMKPSQVVRGRSGIITAAPVEGQVLFMLLHITNVPALDIASESDVYCTAQVFNGVLPKTELMHWPVRDNAKNPVWNTVRSSRKLQKLEADDKIKFAVYDWDDIFADDCIATGTYTVPKDFEHRPNEEPITIKLELSPKAEKAATLAATPAVMRSVAKDTGTWIESILAFPSRAFKFLNRTAEPKKQPTLKIPPMELTFVITEQRERSRANKRVFFIVNAESVADEAEMSAKTDPNLLRKLFSNIPSDHALSTNGIAQAYELKQKLEKEKKRLGEKHKKLKSVQDKDKKKIHHELFTPEDKMMAELLRASCIISSPQSRCIATAMIALQDHLAVGKGRKALIEFENKTEKEQKLIMDTEKQTSDPNAPPIEGEGIVVASYFRDIFFNRAWLDFGEKRGRDLVKRALKLLKEVKPEAINEKIEDVDWMEMLSRYEEINVHPNDCWHEWWDLKPEAPRALQQRSCEALQMLRMMRDELSICVVGGKLLRYLLRDACDKEEMVQTLKPPNANFTRCCVVCADFDFTEDLHSSLIDITLMFDGEILLKENKTKHRIRERRLLNRHKGSDVSINEPPPTSPKGDGGGDDRKSIIPKINTLIFSAEEPVTLNDDDLPKENDISEQKEDDSDSEDSGSDQIGLEEFKELLEEEPDVVIAIGGFFLDLINDLEFRRVTESRDNPSPEPPGEDETEDQDYIDAHKEYMERFEKKLKDESEANLMDGLLSMEIVLSKEDLHAVFDGFSDVIGHVGHSPTVVLEDPNELLMKVVRDLIESRKREAEQGVQTMKRKSTMRERAVWTRSSFAGIGVLATGRGMSVPEEEDNDKTSAPKRTGSRASTLISRPSESEESIRRTTSIRMSDSPERISYRVMDRCNSFEKESDEDDHISPSQAIFERRMHHASDGGEVKSDSDNHKHPTPYDSQKIWNV